jgi:hypothetical protein
MSTITDAFKKKLDERDAAEPETPAVEMTFAGLLCKVRPLPADFYLRSGRMPDFLTRIAFSVGDGEAIKRELEAVKADDVIAGRRFQRVAVSRVLVEPRVADATAGPTDDAALGYAELAERAPDFVDMVFSWIVAGCPVPEKGEEGISTEALQNFPDKPAGTKRARARGGSKTHGRASIQTDQG